MDSSPGGSDSVQVLYQGLYRTDFTDFAGNSEITQATVIVGPANTYNGSCSVQYSPATQQLALLNNAGAVVGSGAIGRQVSGSDLVLSGTQCLLDVTASSATAAGATLSVFLSLSFTTAGSYGWYGQAQALAPPNTVSGPVSASLGSISVTGTTAAETPKGMPATVSPYALNNGTPQTWTYCLGPFGTTQCYPSGEDSAETLTGCQVSGSGVSASIAWPSAVSGAPDSAFDVTFTASSSAVPTARTLTCSRGRATLRPLSNAVMIYDATPVIGAIQPTDPDGNGAFYIQIYGTNFGPSVGSVSVCAESTGSCSDFTISYSSQYSTWSDQQANVLLTPTATATGGVYDVQLTSIGESGTGFVALQSQSQPQSNKGQVVDIRISLAGVGDVTGKTQTVIVGQQIALTASLSGASMSSPSWTITPGPAGQGGMYVGSYSNGKGGPPDTTAGQVDPLVTNQPSITYYYTAANTSTATFSATVNGTTYSRRTGFNVVAPQGSFQAESLGQAGIVMGACPPPNTNLTCALFGPAPSGQPGMNFQFSYTTPSGYNGAYQYTQVGTTAASETNASTGNVASYGPCPSPGMAVDLNFKYAFAQASTVGTNDNPFAQLAAGYSDRTRSDSFIMTVMFQPMLTNAIFVPLASVSWSWSVHATSANAGNTWSIANSTAPPDGPLSPGATTVFPSYSGTLQASCGGRYGF